MKLRNKNEKGMKHLPEATLLYKSLYKELCHEDISFEEWLKQHEPKGKEVTK
jgi:hypothetical protein